MLPLFDLLVYLGEIALTLLGALAIIIGVSFLLSRITQWLDDL